MFWQEFMLDSEIKRLYDMSLIKVIDLRKPKAYLIKLHLYTVIA